MTSVKSTYFFSQPSLNKQGDCPSMLAFGKKTPIQVVKVVGALLEKFKEAISFDRHCIYLRRHSNLEHCLAILIAL